MKEVTFNVVKADVYEEVAKYSSYEGSKDPDESAYKRVFTTEADQRMLERFWSEAVNIATDRLKPFIVSFGSNEESEGESNEEETNEEETQDYIVNLELSSSYDANLSESAQESLFNFFVLLIVSRWYKIANKKEAENYAKEAATLLDDVMRKVYYKKKPTRTAITH